MSVWRLVAVAIVSVGFAARAARGDATSSGASDADLLAQASAAYDAGVAKMATDRTGAAARFQEAAAIWRSLIEERGLQSGPLWYDLGNASLLAGDTGRAVLAFRRAERLMPFDKDLAANLAAARERIGQGAPAPPQPGAVQGVVDVCRVLPGRTRMIAFVGLFAAAWGLGLVRLLLHGRPARWVVVVPAVLAAVLLGSVVLEAVADRREPRGVVVASAGAPTRTGPSDAVHEAASPPLLPPGTEFILVQREGGEDGWSRVRLGNGGEVWVHSSAVELVAG